jgi:hypothetical protein
METNDFITGERKVFYTNHFFETNTGEDIVYALDFLPAIYKGTLPELNAVGFTRSELCLCIDVINATMLQGKLAGRELKSNVEDSIVLDHTDEKWEIDTEAFLMRFRSLSMAQIAVLCLWAHAFWVQHTIEGDKDLEAYVAELAG